MKWITKIFLITLILPLLTIGCSDDNKETYIDVAPFIAQMTVPRDAMAEMRDNSLYGILKDTYPEDSRYILDNAVIKIEKVMREFKNGMERNPSQAIVDEAIANANNSIKEFEATKHLVDVPVESKAVELFVDGRKGAYIDFGHSPDYTNFGELGKQAFTIELWLKLKYTEGFGSVISAFNEDGETQTRKGWVINNFDNSRIRMTIGLENWGLMEPGVNFSTTEKWVHFAAVINEQGVDGDGAVVIKVYLDGELKDQSTRQEGKNYLSNYLETSMIAFGQPAGNGGMTDAWRLSGYIKDFHIWKSAKSEDDIRSLMNQTVKVTGAEDDLVCGWAFDTIADDDQSIKDLTGKHTAKLMGDDYKWIKVED